MLLRCRLMLLGAILAACATQPTTIANKSTPVFTNCPEQRPDICAMDYLPVCATSDAGVRCVTLPCPSTEQKTFSNACSACADIKVIGYSADECPASPNQ